MPAKAVSNADRQDTYIALDVRLGAALESGMEVAEAAKLCGVSERYVYKRQKEGRVRDVRLIFKQFLKVNPVEIRAVAIENARTEFEARLGQAFAGLDEALKDGDVKTKAAMIREVFDRALGKPTSKLEVAGVIEQKRVLLIEPDTLKFLNSLVNASAPLYAGAKKLSPVIDASTS